MKLFKTILITLLMTLTIITTGLASDKQPSHGSVCAKWFWADFGGSIITLGFQSDDVIVSNGIDEVIPNYYEDGRGWVTIEGVPGKLGYLPDAGNLIYVYNNMAIIFNAMLEY